uniref:Uncharacterized protein n=1 Tax=Arion vulgaris TaxID=1028688 RepID=A0A0B7AYX3_9EUPU
MLRLHTHYKEWFNKYRYGAFEDPLLPTFDVEISYGAFEDPLLPTFNVEISLPSYLAVFLFLPFVHLFVYCK